MVPLLSVTGITIIVAVWTSVAFLALLPVEFLVMKSVTGMNPCGSA
jgi:type IV secretion system protein VirB4